jgi:hypothetical protein
MVAIRINGAGSQPSLRLDLQRRIPADRSSLSLQPRLAEVMFIGNHAAIQGSADLMEQAADRGMIRLRRLVPIDSDDPALFDRQRQPAMFQRQCRFAEQLAAPAVQCGYVGIIVRRNLF